MIKTITSIIFLCLLAVIFVKTSYLFRRVDENRRHVLGIQEELTEDDVVYIGGSAAFVYWQPLTAWNNYGITSYVMGTNTIPADNLLIYMKEIKKYQNPKLFIIDARPFQYYGKMDKGESAIGFRNGCDSLSYGKLRNDLITSYILNSKELVFPINSLYLDIIYYHENKQAIGNPDNWKYINNKVSRQTYHGYEIHTEYMPIEKESFETDKSSALDPNAEKLLNEILDYGDSENLNLLFVVAPYAEKKEARESFNTIESIVKQRGYDFLNANKYTKEIQIDYTSDFYNINHVNTFGAEKYTNYLSEYISKKYLLPDHRSDQKYSIWNNDYDIFHNAVEESKKQILTLKNNYTEDKK